MTNISVFQPIAWNAPNLFTKARAVLRYGKMWYSVTESVNKAHRGTDSRRKFSRVEANSLKIFQGGKASSFLSYLPLTPLTSLFRFCWLLINFSLSKSRCPLPMGVDMCMVHEKVPSLFLWQLWQMWTSCKVVFKFRKVVQQRISRVVARFFPHSSATHVWM